MKIKCPKCGSANIRLAPTLPHALSQCFECGNIWRQVYKPRKKANAENCKNLQKSVKSEITPEKTALEIVAIELGKAKGKHSEFPNFPVGAGMIIAEEKAELDCAFDQFCKAVNDQKAKEHLIEESAHVAATAIRFIEGILKKC